jgi:hypothetical protein
MNRNGNGCELTRYKGRQSAKAVEQDFPYHVDMAVPPGGWATG